MFQATQKEIDRKGDAINFQDLAHIESISSYLFNIVTMNGFSPLDHDDQELNRLKLEYGQHTAWFQMNGQLGDVKDFANDFGRALRKAGYIENDDKVVVTVFLRPEDAPKDSPDPLIAVG